MQEVLLLTTDVESKAFSDGALPTLTKLFIQRVFDQHRCPFPIARGLKRVERHGAHFYGFVSHFGGHVRVLYERLLDALLELLVVDVNFVA